jgi:hypothetical protein
VKGSGGDVGGIVAGIRWWSDEARWLVDGGRAGNSDVSDIVNLVAVVITAIKKLNRLHPLLPLLGIQTSYLPAAAVIRGRS